MNAYAALVLGALLFEFTLERVAEVLNLRAMDPEVPERMRGVVDAEKYGRSQEYTRARTRFARLVGCIDLALLLVFWWAGGFPWLERLVRSFGFGEVVTGVLFIGALVFLRGLLGLPLRAWSTFVIEERFGFNRTTPATFALDTVKGVLLGAVLGGGLLALVLWFFASAGALAWLWCWIAISALMIALQFIVPVWILPLFHKFEPLEEGELREGLLGYARSVDFPLTGIYVIDGSRRSTKANAFFTGFGANRRIALFDTLLESQSTPELVAVVAHEVGHYKRKHIQQGVVLGILQMGVVLWVLSLFLTRPELHSAFGMESVTAHAGLVFFGLLYAPIDLALSVAMQAFSRRNEYQADAFAAETTGDPGSLQSALQKLAVENLSNLTPHPLHVALHGSHPPVVERLRALAAEGS
ncbi:MAG: M48 family metallopeptidase [bacterium]|nr:M48 family metallopeptidase [bacterium]